MFQAEHKQRAPKSLAFALITVSDGRDETTDRTGEALARRLAEAGHAVVRRALIRDDEDAIALVVSRALEDPAVQMVVVNGGTGVSPWDVTVEAVRPLLEKELPGFSERFRALSYREVGPSADLSRALAGTAGGKALFCLPGSTAGALLALENLILPEAGHLWAMLHPEGQRRES
jgi:molybdenum cofactor biosynthesis protein B